MTLTRSSIPRTTSHTRWHSLISVLLPHACHRWSLPSRQLYWQSQLSGPRVSGDEACRGGNSEGILHTASCSYCNGFPAYPCWSSLSSGRVFFKAGLGLLFSQSSFFAYECKHRDLQSWERRRKSRFWPRPIPTQVLSLNILWISGWSSLMQWKGYLLYVLI